METASAWSAHPDPRSAVRDVCAQLTARLGGRPDFVVVQHTVSLPAEEIAAALVAALPGVPIHGGTSCLGVMTEEGARVEGGRMLGVFGLRDADGAFGVGSADLDGDAGLAATAAAEAALAQAGRPGERPALLWITGAPGREEGMIAGLRRMFGPGVPVAGGSSADDDVGGNWRQFAGERVHRNGVVVSALFPSRGVAFSFHSGYDSTAHHAVVTRGAGRTILELDGQPAAVVYDGWIGGALGATVREGGSILTRTTLHPLGRKAGEIGGIPYFQLSHPESVTTDGGLTLFSDIAVGDEVVLMRGSQESLVTRAGRVARSAVAVATSPPAGALVIYCAGCMLTVRERMGEVAMELRNALAGRPFLGGFTFGEQGCLPGGDNRHGNLMISVLIFPS